MTESKTIAVVSATGAQGGGLVRAILEDPSSGFTVPAITRDTSSEKAKELARLGAELVAADISDEADLEKAFEGAHAAFCVTFSWAHFSPGKEMAEARNMAKATSAARRSKRGRRREGTRCRQWARVAVGSTKAS
ncbi:MAG: NmrA family NAD(P)-binding protein [Acidobacteriota bacterium]|nr:MAG: NmrA family NAD(P)-binding protein [Acidobacteriota bacterium]